MGCKTCHCLQTLVRLQICFVKHTINFYAIIREFYSEGLSVISRQMATLGRCVAFPLSKAREAIYIVKMYMILELLEHLKDIQTFKLMALITLAVGRAKSQNN